jgi:hypothetical protein
MLSRLRHPNIVQYYGSTIVCLLAFYCPHACRQTRVRDAEVSFYQLNGWSMHAE